MWVTIEKPGQLGKRRHDVEQEWTQQYGKDNWRIAYEWGSTIITRPDALQIYEDGYYEFFQREPARLEWLVKIASDVYDTAPTNVQAGLSYEHQETPNNHIHDVSIRRALLRLGRQFEGNRLVRVRWIGSEGFDYNPGVVPFHLPHMIAKGELKNRDGGDIWWHPNTIEDFYQRNKVLQVQR